MNNISSNPLNSFNLMINNSRFISISAILYNNLLILHIISNFGFLEIIMTYFRLFYKYNLLAFIYKKFSRENMIKFIYKTFIKHSKYIKNITIKQHTK